jgi:probable phosphoglycerate mutase
MRLLFIRHGDPDYSIDNLTEKGKIEAKLLSNVIGSFGIDEVYQSPLGRAMATCEYSLKVLGKEAVTLDWLREFPALFDPNLSESAKMAYANELRKDPVTGKYYKRIVWDVLPSYFGDHQELFDRYKWRDSELVKCSNMIEVYDGVRKSFFDFLSDNGYEKDGDIFRVKEGNDKTLALFCHFGITSVLLSMLWNVSPFVPMQYLAAAPTSVTEVVTEEREKGIAVFRTLRIGDITHLTMGKEKPSFSARFCERYENENERH